MVPSSVFFIILIIAAPLTVYAESVQKFKDESGATVYSDQQQLQGATEVETIKLAPGPSEAEQQAAQERVERTKSAGEEMEKSRQSAQKAREQQEKTTSSEVIQLDSNGTNLEPNRIDPKRHIPLESSDGGEHKIYQPIEGQPAHVTPRPAAAGGGRR